ncbi:MAG: thiamine pyrophosphate-dependent enzyme [Desulfobacterales bacterium]|jgi:pyruvate/2-oxoacid:ferredoxin oxidoreductase beta subunit/Pyruvate/2-oxoacid:ferredoxin oxidoreductase gamma subunit
MDSLLNPQRPPVFCPGCAHDQVTKALDKALTGMGLAGNQVVLVSDIGCSGLFDTFFHTHAFHGLHGRALTYATGLKMVRPELTVIVTMGDGGLGIGGAHLLSTCRKNIDLTLLVLNNFNYGMTGGQCSSTTPADARVASGFLNRIEKPVDVCRLAASAGAGYTARSSAYRKDLVGEIQAAIRFEGFSLLDIWGVCPGRYTKKNKLTPAAIETSMAALPEASGAVAENARPEYGRLYREKAAACRVPDPPQRIEAGLAPPNTGRQEVLILGSAGQRIVTAGELLCLGGITAGLQATLKNDYPITVLRGHSVSEVVLCAEAIGFTGIESPRFVLALAQEGVNRKKAMIAGLDASAVIFRATDVDLPDTGAAVIDIDFKQKGIRPTDRALAALAMLAEKNEVISKEMLEAALKVRFKGEVLEKAMLLVEKAGRWSSG